MSKPESLPKYPIFERVVKRDNSIYIIILIVITILVAVGAFILYLIYRNRDTRQITRCEPGLCVINLTTGEKRCPASLTEQMSYDQVFEDCTSSNYCQSEKNSCAVLANGTLNCRGVCGAGNEKCRCQKPPI